jgi:hypothetical protein
VAGYRESFGSNVDYAYGRGVRDIGGTLERGMSNLSNSGAGIAAIAKQAQAARGRIKDLTRDISSLQAQQNATQSLAQWTRLQNQIDNTRKSVNMLRKDMRQLPFDVLEKGLGKLTKGLIGMNTSILTIGFDFLISSIKRVYELQERWTKAIGGFNLRIGGMTAGLRGAQKAATSWSSTIRGLTDGDISEGIQMFADFTDAIGRTVESGDQFERFGLQLARGFNLGGEGAGQLTKVLQNIGDSGDDARETMKAMIKGANAAHVPVNLLAKDLQQSSTYMARFGKEGQKTFVTGAAWARKYTISIEQLKTAVEGLDLFDEAARTASKLNVAFGTMINSMDLMMEDDPAKRLDMIREQFLAQGKTFDQLTPKQTRYLSETLKLTEDQVAALLNAKNAGESYSDFQKKAAAKEKDELNAKQMMEVQLRKTVQTMYAFGAAFDRITVAIANAIKPLLVVLGLASDGDKKFTGFGEVMESITVTVEAFFNSLAKNDKWQDFMKELAKDMLRAGHALKEFVMDGRAADLMGDIARGMKTFYGYVRDLAITIAPAMRPLLDAFLFLSKHLDKIVIAYGALKGMGMIRSLAAPLGAGPTGLLGKVGAMGARAGGGMIAGGAAGMMLGGSGAGIGGMIGGLLGPIGGIVGALGGKLIEKLVDWFDTSGKSDLEVAKEELEEQIKRETKVRENYTGLVDLAARNQQAEDRIRKSRNDVLRSMEEAAGKQADKKLTLGEMELEMLRTRANELGMFGKNAKEARKILGDLGVGSQLTQKQLGYLLEGAKAYEDELSKLRDATKAQADIELSRLQVSRVGQQKESGEALKALREQELKSLRTELDELGGSARAPGRTAEFVRQQLEDVANRTNVSRSNVGILGDEAQRKAVKKTLEDQLKRLEVEDKIDKLDMANTKAQGDLLKKQTEFLKAQTAIQLKSFIMSSTDFLDFMQSTEEKGKGPNQIFEDYLRTHEADIIQGITQEGYDLIRQGPNISAVIGTPQATPRPGMFNGNTTPQNFMAPTAGGPTAMTTPSVTHTVAEITMDGQKVGRALVRTAIS